MDGVYECGLCGKVEKANECPEGWDYVISGPTPEDMCLACESCLSDGDYITLDDGPFDIVEG